MARGATGVVGEKTRQRAIVERSKFQKFRCTRQAVQAAGLSEQASLKRSSLRLLILTAPCTSRRCCCDVGLMCADGCICYFPRA
jgi:hypothetical protein